MKSEQEIKERLAYLETWFQSNKEIKVTDYALYREMLGRLRELEDMLECQSEVEVD